MTPFKELSLPEQIAQLQKGDLVTTDTGAVVSFTAYGVGNTIELALSTYYHMCIPVSVITSIHRPEPPVPEIVKKLRQLIAADYPFPVEKLAEIMADYFEQEARK
jgi:hypothetical protein